MQIIPAIDLKDGKVVRLLQGRFDEEKVYDESPESIAKRFESEGAGRIHVVDLDGALHGAPKNRGLVESIIQAVKIPVEVGGGIRSIEDADAYLKLGARWVIFGTKACLDMGFLKEALAEFGESAIIGIDAKDGFVAVDGWTKVLSIKALELAREVEKKRGRTIIYTDISKDGALKGPNLSQVDELSNAVRVSIIASGGVGCLDDLKSLRDLGKKNLSGVIVGKAIYEKKFTVAEAVQCLQSA